MSEGPRWKKKKGNDLLEEKAKIRKKEGVRKFCRRDQSPISWLKMRSRDGGGRYLYFHLSNDS